MKLENILIGEDGAGSPVVIPRLRADCCPGHVVLTDFGLSAIVRDGKVHSFSGTAIYIGTSLFLSLSPRGQLTCTFVARKQWLTVSAAPEVLDDAGHGKSVDWWGYGVLLHVLLTGAVRTLFARSREACLTRAAAGVLVRQQEGALRHDQREACRRRRPYSLS